MPTSQLEKEQRDSLKSRIRKARQNHEPERDVKDPINIRAARRMVARWETYLYKTRNRISSRLHKRANKLEEELLFTEPRKMLAKIERFEKTGK